MERIDDLQYNGLKLIQDDEQFCFGCDAVELANFVEGARGERACDLGCGGGIIPVLVAEKRGMLVVGVEIQREVAFLAERNVALNNMQSKIEIVNEPMQTYAAKAANVGAFDIVVCNPPYSKLGNGFIRQNRAVAVARHEIEVTLEEVVGCAKRLLKSGGKFFTVGRTERLAETLALCDGAKLKPKVLQILRPNDSKPPHLFLLKCSKDGADGLKVLPERAIRSYGME